MSRTAKIAGATGGLAAALMYALVKYPEYVHGFWTAFWHGFLILMAAWIPILLVYEIAIRRVEKKAKDNQ